jgi:hypothetical protein
MTRISNAIVATSETHLLTSTYLLSYNRTSEKKSGDL